MSRYSRGNNHLRQVKPILLAVFFIILLAVMAGMFLPMKAGVNAAQAKGTGTLPVMLGTFTKGYMNQATIDAEVKTMDTWAGKQASLVGVTMEFGDTNLNFIAPQLDAIWNNGYTPFIRLKTGWFIQNATSSQFASGVYDSQVAAWASAYAAWAVGGRFAFISLLPDMNLPWVSYSGDPVSYIAAYGHIRDIFRAAGGSARWVFDASGWPNMPFVDYYPGESLVDVLGLSGYNYGYCAAGPQPQAWEDAHTVFEKNLVFLRGLSLRKPVFITRIGSTAYAAGGIFDTVGKNAWLYDAYSFLGDSQGVRAIIAQNTPDTANAYDCDWVVYNQNIQYVQYRNVIENTNFGYVQPNQLASADLGLAFHSLYLPRLNREYATANGNLPVMLGMYTTYADNAWPDNQTVIDNWYKGVENWSGKKLSIVGKFISLATPVDQAGSQMRDQLILIWNNGYIPFINLDEGDGHNAYQIATGSDDTYAVALAKAYAAFARGGGGRMAYIAPLQEMDGSWVSYSRDPANYKLAYLHIRQIFIDQLAAQGVAESAIQWVFSPNGWHYKGDPAFEAYYPGDQYVDVVGFSAYNFNANGQWQNPNQVYNPDYNTSTPECDLDPWDNNGCYIDRLVALAPNKPIFVSQTATVSGGGMIPNSQKDTWLTSAYNYLAGQNRVRAVIYFNSTDPRGDLHFFVPGDPSKQFRGYILGVANPAFDYVPPQVLKFTPLWAP